MNTLWDNRTPELNNSWNNLLPEVIHSLILLCEVKGSSFQKILTKIQSHFNANLPIKFLSRNVRRTLKNGEKLGLLVQQPKDVYRVQNLEYFLSCFSQPRRKKSLLSLKNDKRPKKTLTQATNSVSSLSVQSKSKQIQRKQLEKTKLRVECKSAKLHQSERDDQNLMKIKQTKSVQFSTAVNDSLTSDSIKMEEDSVDSHCNHEHPSYSPIDDQDPAGEMTPQRGLLTNNLDVSATQDFLASIF